VRHGKRVPLAIKIAPDMSDEETALVAQALMESGMDAVIATNTTLSRVGVEGMEHGDEAGGLSGAPVRERAPTPSRCWRLSWGALADHRGRRHHRRQARGEKIAAGASLVQFYSGFIYKGPALIRESVDAIGFARQGLIRRQ
jgi:dihydroorotate dehydrogenase